MSHTISDALLERAKRATGKRTAAAAVRALVERAERVPRVSVAQLVREERKPGKRFRSADEVMRYLDRST